MQTAGKTRFTQPSFARTLFELAPAIVGMILVELLFPVAAANAQKLSRPAVPDAIQVPAGSDLVLMAHASGSQIYACRGDADGKFAWTLKAPDAVLKDEQGNAIGSHFAGPTWKLNDNSEVTGKTAARVDSDDPDAIPWLLVEAVSHFGRGMFSAVTQIQRVYTHGGKPPAAGCDEAHREAEIRSNYTADYYFYVPHE